MAYMKGFKHRCGTPGCSRDATVEVFNDRNALCGRFCRSHGLLEVHRLDSARERDGADADAKTERKKWNRIHSTR